MWMTEEEILSLDSAAVDANINDGVIYVTRYVEPDVQDASIVDYQPNADVLERMASDPNIVELSKRELSVTARKELEDRLAAYEEKYETDEDGNTVEADADETRAGSTVGPANGVTSTTTNTTTTTASTEASTSDTTEDTDSTETSE
jgi:hypothetical protein